MSAATKSFRQVLFGICRRVDKDVPTDTRTAAHFGEFINSAVKLAWEYYPWPERLKLQSEALQAHPDIAGARYIPRLTASRHIALLSNLFSACPLVSSSFQAIPFTERADGFYVHPACSWETVWLDYRAAPPEFTSDLHDPDKTYEAASLVWEGQVNGLGHVFKALQNVPAATALSNAEYWEAVTIPARLSEAVMAGAIGAFHASEGNHGTARVKLEYMQDLIEHEIIQITSQSGQNS